MAFVLVSIFSMGMVQNVFAEGDLVDTRNWNQMKDDIYLQMNNELKKGTTENTAKLMIFSNAEWSGKITSTDGSHKTISGIGNSIYSFECSPSIGMPNPYNTHVSAFFADDERAYVHLFVIQDGEILKDSSSTGKRPDVDFPWSTCKGSIDPMGISQRAGCLIATATYGTELSPQVQMLREVRDNILLNTVSGYSFMTGFNQIYYSFSPTIADLERENPVFLNLVRGFITPLMSTLSIMTLVEEGSEFQVLFLGSLVILINIGIYVALPSFLIFNSYLVVQKKFKKYYDKKFTNLRCLINE